MLNLLYLTQFKSNKDESDITAFEDAGYKVTVLNANERYFLPYLPGFPSFKNIINLYEGKEVRLGMIRDKTQKVLKKILTGVRLDCSSYVMKVRENLERNMFKRITPDIRKKIQQVMQDNKIDVVYSTWGITCFPEIKAIQDAGFFIPTILNVETYPFYFTDTIDIPSSKSDPVSSEIIKKLAGRIYGTELMKKYFEQNFETKSFGKNLVMMSFFREKYLYKRRCPLLSEKDNSPHLIFIGNTAFSQRTVDDVRSQLYEIAESEIHVHLGQPDIKLKKHPYVHVFPLFGDKQVADGTFTTFMTQFDGSIMLYNLDKVYMRFYISLPLRFLTAVYSGIPVFASAKYFAGCAEIIDKYKIGFAYKDIQDMRKVLLDKLRMDVLRNDCLAAAPALTFERNFHLLNEFIKDVVNSYSAGKKIYGE